MPAPRPISNLLAAACFSAFVGIACAFPAQTPGLIPSATKRFDSDAPTVNVSIGGGEDTRLWGKTQVSNDALREAVIVALARSGLFLPLVDKPADYQLKVTLLEIQQPDWSLATPVRVDAGWTLAETGSGNLVWAKRISTTFTAPFSAALIGTKRCRIATEGATRENIVEAIRKLSTLAL